MTGGGRYDEPQRVSLPPGDTYERDISVSAGATETHTLTDFPKEKASLLFIQSTVTSSTDTAMSIHEGQSFDKTDMVYRVTKVADGDVEPTGGYPGVAMGLPWMNSNQTAELYIKTVENSGNAGTLSIRIKYI